MRWFAAIIGLLFLAFVIYVGSAFYSLSQLTQAARAADATAVLARTDVPALNRSLTDQIVRAYLGRIGETRKVSQMERAIASTYGASVADAMVAKFLTPEGLTEILKTGRFSGADQAPAFTGMPALGEVKTDDIVGLLGRIGFVQPTLLSVRVSQTEDSDSYAAIALHLDGSGWRLAGIDLPRTVVRQLAASLPVK